MTEEKNAKIVTEQILDLKVYFKTLDLDLEKMYGLKKAFLVNNVFEHYIRLTFNSSPMEVMIRTERGQLIFEIYSKENRG